MYNLEFFKPYRINFDFDTMFPSLDNLFKQTKKQIIPVEGFVEKNDTEFVDLGDKYKADFDYDESLDFKTCEVKVENNTLSISFSQEGEHSYREFSYSRNIPNDANANTAKAIKKDGKISVTFEKKN